MRGVATIELDIEEAQQKYTEYRDAVKKRASRQYSQLKRAYRAAAKGYKLIDIYAAFSKSGKKNDLPKLAIARADRNVVYFAKQENGSGQFTNNESSWRGNGTTWADNVDLPEGTFSDFLRPVNRTWGFVDERMVTNVPIVPAHLMPEDKLENYYVLFEVEEWRSTAKVRDPFLLKRVNENTFIVMAEWDVSPVEAIVMRSA